MSILSKLPKIKEAKKSAKRVGRGYGSGKGGHTATRGMKGQKSRTGGKPKIWFEGGQTPLVHRMPYKGGFINHNSKAIYEINLSDLADLFDGKKDLTPEVVLEKRNVKGNYLAVKVLSKGTLEKPLNLKGFQYSEKAKSKIESAGGKAE